MLLHGEELATTIEDQKYVPDVRCPGCAKEIHLEERTYSFYQGNVPCEHCVALVGVLMGDEYYDPMAQTHYKTARPREGLRGGRLLAEPTLVEPPVAIPPSFLQVLQSEGIPPDARRMGTAIRHYAEGNYGGSIATMCRAAVQAALADQGIPDEQIGRMVAKAEEQGLLRGFAARCCHAVTTAGGEAAHGPEWPEGQREALSIIGLTAVVLGRLYAIPR